MAVLPIDSSGKICLIKIWRHAVSSWELEIPGAPNNRETSVENALRELKEETEFLLPDRLIHVGSMNPDSGILSTNLDIFIAFSSHKELFKPDETEVIAGLYSFSIPDLEEGIKKGFLEIVEKEKTNKISLKILSSLCFSSSKTKRSIVRAVQSFYQVCNGFWNSILADSFY